MAYELKESKGKEIADRFQLKFDGQLWTVPSQTGKGEYIVDLLAQTCTCPDFVKNLIKCKHLCAVEEKIRREHLALVSPERERAARRKPTYQQNWKTYNLAQQNEKRLFLDLLFELCRGAHQTKTGRGRPPALTSDLLFCLCLKTFNGPSGRRHNSDVEDAHEKGYLSEALHYNTIMKNLEREGLALILRDMIETTASILKSVETEFAIDASGFSTSIYKRWFDVKYRGDEDWKDWYKLNLCCGVKTGIVTAVEISERYSNDSRFYRKLFDSTMRIGFLIDRTFADAIYTTKDNLRHTEENGATQISPFKSNAVYDAKDTVWNKMLHFYLARADEFHQIYHHRSRVEALFSAMKRKFGHRLRTRTRAAQVNEMLAKVLCYNLSVVIHSMYDLGIEPELVGLFFRKPEDGEAEFELKAA